MKSLSAKGSNIPGYQMTCNIQIFTVNRMQIGLLPISSNGSYIDKTNQLASKSMRTKN